MSGPEKPIIHGADHVEGGADPIPGLVVGGGEDEVGIDFDQANSGGYLDIHASSAIPTETESIRIEAANTTGYADAALMLRAIAGVLRMEAKHLYMQLGVPVSGHINFESAAGALGLDAKLISLYASEGLTLPSLRTTEPTDATEVWEDDGVICIGPGGAGAGGGGVAALSGNRIGATADRWYSAGQQNTSSPTTNSTVANRLELLPFVPSRDMTLDRIAVQVTNTVAANGRLGMWNDDGNLYPNSLLFDTGTFSIGTTGPKVTTISQPVTAGALYWLGFVSSVSTISMRGWQAADLTPILGIGAWSGTTSQAAAFGWMLVGAGMGALPNPFTAGAAAMTVNDGVPAAVAVRGT